MIKSDKLVGIIFLLQEILEVIWQQEEIDFSSCRKEVNNCRYKTTITTTAKQIMFGFNLQLSS